MLKLVIITVLCTSLAHAAPDEEDKKPSGQESNVHYLACDKKLNPNQDDVVGYLRQVIGFSFPDGTRATIALGPYLKPTGQVIDQSTFFQSVLSHEINETDVSNGRGLTRHIFEKYSFSEDWIEINLHGDNSNPIHRLRITLDQPYDPTSIKPYLQVRSICFFTGTSEADKLCASEGIGGNYINMNRRVPSVLASLRFEGRRASELLNALPLGALKQQEANSMTTFSYRGLHFTKYNNGLVRAEADRLTPAEYLHLTSAFKKLGLTKDHPIFVFPSNRPSEE